jgi:hypothetical protein
MNAITVEEIRKIYRGAGSEPVRREISVALGRQAQSTDLKERHPLDGE